jgi:thiol-disulfide isomerase/thioredoxin
MMSRHTLLKILLVVCLLPAAVGPAYPLADGLIAPELVVESWHQTAGKPSVKGLRGKVILLNFWGLWCSPCVQALPDLNALTRNYGDRGLAVIGIHTPAKADQLTAFLEQHQVNFPVGVDTEKTAQRYQLRNYPTYVLIDRQGRIHATSFAVPTAETIDKLLLDRP